MEYTTFDLTMERMGYPLDGVSEEAELAPDRRRGLHPVEKSGGGLAECRMVSILDFGLISVT